MDEVAAAGAPGPVYAGGRLPGGAVFKAVLLPHPYGGGRDIYPSVHHAHRHTAGPAVRRDASPLGAAPAAGMYIKVAKMSDGTTRTSKVVVR